MESQATANIFLNYDVINSIFSQLSFLDLVNCHGVSPLFAEVATDQFRRRFKHLVLDNDDGTNSLAKLKRVFDLVGPWVQHLTIDSERASNTHMQYLHYITKMCPVLEIMEFTNQYFNSPESDGTPHLRKLQTLVFYNSSFGDKRVASLLQGCSDHLQAMSFTLVAMSGKCLAKAPGSVTTLAFIETPFLRTAHVIAYLQRNQNIRDFTLVKDVEDDIDLNMLCSHLRRVKMLKLHCSQFHNFEALADLEELTNLDMIIRNNNFYRYPSSLGNSIHNLTELRLEFINMDITLDLAESFRCFKRLSSLKLFFDSTVTNQNRLISHLGALPQLDHLTLTGEPCDLDLVCSQLTQIKSLRIDVISDNLQQLARLRRLNELQVSVDAKLWHKTAELTVFINQFIVSVARSNTLNSLSLQIPTKVKLNADSLTALKTFELEHLQLYGGFCGCDAVMMARNLACLKTFTQFHSSLEMYRDEAQLRSVRPDTLKVTLHKNFWMQL